VPGWRKGWETERVLRRQAGTGGGGGEGVLEGNWENWEGKRAGSRSEVHRKIVGKGLKNCRREMQRDEVIELFLNSRLPFLGNQTTE
jgi:hypothetical protein